MKPVNSYKIFLKRAFPLKVLIRFYNNLIDNDSVKSNSVLNSVSLSIPKNKTCRDSLNIK